ncbi:uncharacterized protein LOC130928130 isoform X2 [Corythoichthys intestinalis]|uniref:uncharacterized protein LOC130928130 isoform X2 n=1 Tax=Corythoichthys intestinalis TaxID=161448 RepID=UPI0025A5EB79|nr:uncharacterized protein LOC130928130 isoform X2 [Corythoichthys intestinalis]
MIPPTLHPQSSFPGTQSKVAQCPTVHAWYFPFLWCFPFSFCHTAQFQSWQRREERMLLIWSFFLNALMPSMLHGEAVCPCSKARLPPPTNLSHEWLDSFRVKVVWMKPSKLPKHCKVMYSDEKGEKTEHTSHTRKLLKSDAGSSGLNFTVRTIGSCEEQGDAASVVLNTPKPRAVLARDFKCVFRVDNMNCSWIPIRPSDNLNVSFRICSESEDKQCELIYRDGIRNGCILGAKFVREDVCVLLRSDTSDSTFRPQLLLDPPKLNVTVTGDMFILSWTSPELGKNCGLKYELCYYRCGGEKDCNEYMKRETSIPYDTKCHYDFQVRVKGLEYCKHLESDFSPLVSHGTVLISAQTFLIRQDL